MVEHFQKAMDRCYTLNMKEIISLVLLVLTLVGAYNSVLASVDSRYATKEYVETMNVRIERVDGNLQRLLDHFSIRGIENVN